MSPNTFMLYGALDFALTAPRETPRRGSLDTVEQSFQTSRREAFRVDNARGGLVSRFPGYHTMFIDEIERTEEVPEGTLVNGKEVGAYEQRLKGLGLLDGKDKISSDPIAQPEDGWDTGEHEIYTTDPAKYQLKAQHPLYPTLYITDRSVESEIGTIKRVRLGYKGIVPVEYDALGLPVPKGYKRRYSTSAATNQTRNPVQIYKRVLVSGVWTWLPEDLAYNYNLDASRVQITDTFLSTTPPDLNSIPGNWQPPGTPDVLNPISGMTLLQPPGEAVLTATEIVRNRPWGWVLRSLAAEQIFDLPVWLYTLTGEWVPELDIKIG